MLLSSQHPDRNSASGLTGSQSRTSRFFSKISASFRYRWYGWRTPTVAAPSHAILKGISAEDQPLRHMSFTFSVVALSARIACADGKLTREKYIAFRESFPLKIGICSKIRALFTLACTDQVPLEHYVSHIACSYPKHQELHLSVLDHLFRIAYADGVLSREEEQLVMLVAHGLGVAPAAYNQVHARYVQATFATGKKQAHHVLGVSAHIKPNELKKRYYELMRNYHPDRFSGVDLSPELQMLLSLKASEISTAYRVLSKRAA